MPIALRSDFDASTLRRLARRTNNSGQARRLIALATIYDGGSRVQAAETGGVTRQIVRDWVVKFNADGAEGLIDRKIPGRPSKLDETHRDALRRLIESGPIPAVHGVVRWRLVDLVQWIYEEFRISLSKQTLSRELRAVGFRKLTARPRHHAQRTEDIEGFKKISHPARRDCPCQWRGPVRIEIWFADEARIGQKNKITRRWARRGTRPSAPHDQRTASTYIVGAMCPQQGKSAGLVLPPARPAARPGLRQRHGAHQPGHAQVGPGGSR